MKSSLVKGSDQITAILEVAHRIAQLTEQHQLTLSQNRKMLGEVFDDLMRALIVIEGEIEETGSRPD